MVSCLLCSIFLFALTLFINFLVSKSFSLKISYIKIGSNSQDEASWLSYACVVALFGYIIFYQLGLGPIPYFIGSGMLIFYIENC